MYMYMYTTGMFIHTLVYMYNDNEYVNFVHFKIIYTLIIMFLKKAK